MHNRCRTTMMKLYWLVSSSLGVRPLQRVLLPFLLLFLPAPALHAGCVLSQLWWCWEHASRSWCRSPTLSLRLLHNQRSYHHRLTMLLPSKPCTGCPGLQKYCFGLPCSASALRFHRWPRRKLPPLLFESIKCKNTSRRCREPVAKGKRRTDADTQTDVTQSPMWY